jgi:hypothetical protein
VGSQQPLNDLRMGKSDGYNLGLDNEGKILLCGD